MFENLTVSEFFPTVVWVIDLKPEKFRAMNARMMAKIEAMLTPRPPLAPGEAWQTHQRLHDLEEFAEFTACVRAAARGACDFLKIEYDPQGLLITGCWANIVPPGVSHVSHVHPNNYLSGVYYLRAAPGADRIGFTDPRAQASVIAPRPREPNRYNGQEAAMVAKEGRFILFPAWLRHGVPTNKSSEDRVSIAFNVMFTDYGERHAAPVWDPNVRG